MRNIFDAVCDFLDKQTQPNEHYLAWFEGEHTNFVRFNYSAVRQGGNVLQISVEIRLIKGNRHTATRVGLSGDPAIDEITLHKVLTQLRETLPFIPEDPFLLYSTEGKNSESIRRGRLPEKEHAIHEIVAASQNTDLVGILASGPICRGFASSLDARQWHETDSFNFDFSLYLTGDKAVKSRYAGFEWNPNALQQTVDAAKNELAILQRPAQALAPGKYRAYLAPSALVEIFSTIAWGGFGIKAQRTCYSPLMRLVQREALLSPQLTVIENTTNGIAPNFESQGFAKPPTVPLITKGEITASLISPRSAKEFNLTTTGANVGENPEALEVLAGGLASESILKELDTGIYINNLWYLNFSDRPAGRITGMTRFATFWVENGKIVAPINVMRFDESIYRMLGNNLIALTHHREYLIDPSSYGTRSTQSWHLPGALLQDFTITL